MAIIFHEWAEPNFRLVNRFYKQNGYKGKANGDDRVFILFDDSQDHSDQNAVEVLAAVRLTPINRQYYFLRGMWVDKNRRGESLGSQLLQSVNQTLDLPCWCFPYDHLKLFYSQHQYLETEPTEAPEWIRQQFLRMTNRGEKILLMYRNLS